MGAREEIHAHVSGLGVDLLTDFFTVLLNGLERFESAEALYQDYVSFCMARDAVPASLGAFSEVLARMIAKFRRVMH